MPHNELVSEARKLDLFFYALINDVIEVTRIIEQRGDELSHRLYVRTVFAFVEGVIQVMKSTALLFDQINDPPLLTPEEIATLKEQDVQLGSDGEKKPLKRKIGLLSNLELSLSTYAKVRGQCFKLDKGGEGWRSLKEAIKIRDRLTHPHKLKDLEVSIGELEVVDKGMQFFREITAPLLQH